MAKMKKDDPVKKKAVKKDLIIGLGNRIANASTKKPKAKKGVTKYVSKKHGAASRIAKAEKAGNYKKAKRIINR